MAISVDDLERAERVEDRGALHRRTARDRVRARRVGVPSSSGSLSDIERDGRGSTFELVHDRCVASCRQRRCLEGEGKELHSTAIDVELLEAEHDDKAIGGLGRELLAEHVAVAVAVHVAVHAHVYVGGFIGVSNRSVF